MSRSRNPKCNYSLNVNRNYGNATRPRLHNPQGSRSRRSTRAGNTANHRARTGENVWPDSESFGDSSAALSECSRQLADQTGEWHIQRAIQNTGFRLRVVLKHFDGNGGIITDDYASLDHSQQAGDAFGFAESAGCVDDRIGIVANPSREDRGQSQTDFG